MLQEKLSNLLTDKLKSLELQERKAAFVDMSEINEELDNDKRAVIIEEDVEEIEEEITEAKKDVKINSKVSVNVESLDDKIQKKVQKLMKKTNDKKLLVISLDGDNVELGANRTDVSNTVLVPLKSVGE
jgi:DNA-directed RNA polymerase